MKYRKLFKHSKTGVPRMEWWPIVNVNKTKIVHFRKPSTPCTNRIFQYGGKIIEVVSGLPGTASNRTFGPGFGP